MTLPREVPSEIAFLCRNAERFYIDPIQTVSLKTQFKHYMCRLLERTPSSPVEQLFVAAANQNLDALVQLTYQTKAHEFPVLFKWVQALVDMPKAGRVTEKVLMLYCSPWLLRQPKYGARYIESLFEAFPRYRRDFLSHAYLNQISINWNALINDPDYCDIAVLATSPSNKAASKTLAELYQTEKRYEILKTWMIVDPLCAAQSLGEHPNRIEAIHGMGLLSDYQLLAKHAHWLSDIRTDDIRDVMTLMFDMPPAVRNALTVGKPVDYLSFEPEDVRLLCAEFKHKQHLIAPPQGGSGSAYAHFTLRAHHARRETQTGASYA